MCVCRSRSTFMVLSAAALLILSCHLPSAYAAGSVREPETSYLKENDSAMTRMMDAMSVAPSGDVDHDFVSMMIPHHQGAIDMAQAELRYGKSEQLRRIAQEIVVEQHQEIVAMHLALGQALPPSLRTPDQITAAPNLASGDRPSAVAKTQHMQMRATGHDVQQAQDK